MQVSPWNPGDWLSEHWTQLIGWSLVVAFLSRLLAVARKLINYGDGIDETKANLTLIMTNHLPHIQAELEKVNDNISGLRADMRENQQRLSEDIRLVLLRMQ